ncbi:MAG: chemotaxis protein CheB [Jatrophihabitans sp.]|uniref:chemotaxis protein CheB n=1 Tax=Jatrophihabitans sp. TaxID=1932789 RepID=UPI00390D56FD
MQDVEHNPEPGTTTASRVVVIAASFGGLQAIRTVLATLPEAFPAPIAVVLHRAVAPADPLARILARDCQLAVRAAANLAPLLAGTVAVFPAGHRCGVAPNHRVRVRPADGQRLSADLVMQDAAHHYQAGTIGVVLTGKLADGAQGVRGVKRAGGTVIVQDPAECAAAGMPTAALATGCVDHTLPLAMIGPTLIALAMAPGVAELGGPQATEMTL